MQKFDILPRRGVPVPVVVEGVEVPKDKELPERGDNKWYHLRESL